MKYKNNCNYIFKIISNNLFYKNYFVAIKNIYLCKNNKKLKIK